MTKNWQSMAAADLGRGVKAGKIDAVELTDSFLEAIAKHPDGARIYAQVTDARARSEAEAARARAKSGNSLGPLDGVPISWKDLVDSAGVRTEAGSLLLQGRVPEKDALILRRATAAGSVCLGKTHMSELAFSGLGYNPMTQTPPNVNDADWTPGGSSSGAASSVAFGLAAAAIGSDTGGSVRIPAAWNDLVGLKTTSGLVSLDGIVPLCPLFDTIGPLARSVEDVALVHGLVQGEIPEDLEPMDLAGARIAILESVAMDAVEAVPAKGFAQAVAEIQAAGAKVSSLNTQIVSEALALSGVLYATEAYASWGEKIEAAPEKMFDQVRERFRGGLQYTGVEYARAWQELHRLRARWEELTKDFDAVILPTSPILPPVVARLAVDDAYYVDRNLLALRNTRIGNLFGGASLSLPTSQASSGLMVMGAPLSETRLLRLGVALEAVLSRS